MIGNAGAETTERSFSWEDVSGDYEEILKKRPRGGDCLSHVFPMDPIRKKYAEILADFALDFSVLHEAAHITNGHSEYVNSLGTPLLMEMNAAGRAVSGYVSQYFEIVADSHAAAISWWNAPAKMTDSELDSRAKMDRSNDLVIPSELFMFDWVFSVAWMFNLFDQNIDPQLLHEDTHPPPTERLVQVNLVVLGILNKEAPQLQSVWERAQDKAVKQLNQSTEFFGDKKIFEKIRQYLELRESGVIEQHIECVLKAGDAIKKDLEKFSHFLGPNVLPDGVNLSRNA
jgi:hypothetical protein